MPLDDTWFTESLESQGSAFSLKIARKLHEEQSPFQRIEVYETTHWGRLLVLDGAVMLTQRDNFTYHEMMAHPVLFTHPNPRDVLIIGGGDCGMLREVLKHDSVRRAVQVDIDERVTRVAEQFFPELTEGIKDPRAQLLFEDGLRYLKEAPAASFDVIIVDSTDPVGPAAGLFGPEFMRDAYRALRLDGLIVQQSESPILHLGTILTELYAVMRDAGFAKVVTLTYPVVGYPSGWWSATMASKGADLTKFREQDALNKRFETHYYNAAIHRGALAVPEFCKKLFTDQ